MSDPDASPDVDDLEPIPTVIVEDLEAEDVHAHRVPELSDLSPAAQDFFRSQPFAPDPFQVEAVAHVDAGRSVVVTAPTGAGKTLIAEAAVHLALSAGKRAFYTAPIKALSNQKFGDFREVYGDAGVGLLTGDNVINGDAPVVVMTTEVLRNMIYAESTALHDLGVVVLDEVHYLQDRYRGSVWEEVIIHLPQGIRLVNLSATIANPQEFTSWVEARRGATGLVVETHRPVPLESTYLIKDRHQQDGLVLLPIFGRDGKRPNPQVVKLLRKGRGRFRRFATPRRLETVELLAREGLLPAIYFVFSRAGCDQAAHQVAAARLGFTTRDERARIRAVADERTAHLAPDDLAVLGYERFVDTLQQGVAAHHAGMVPAFKETVEELFAAGLIQVVFATETLALGINMPARTVVIEKLSKFTGETHELLQPGDYTQLTGRAGRRGIDERGTAVVLHSHHVPFDKVAAIAAAGSHPLTSSFQPTYNMAVNLVANYPQERAEELLNASFAQYRAERERRRLVEELERKRSEAAQIREAARCERGDVFDFLGGGDINADHRSAMSTFVRRLHAGDVLEIEGERMVLLARGLGGRTPRVLLLSETGKVLRVKPADLPSSMRWVGTISLPEPFAPRDPRYQRQVVRELRRFEPKEPAQGPFDDAGEAHPVASCPDLKDHVRWARRALRAERELARLERRLDRLERGDLVATFRAILRLLGAWNYTKGWSLTWKGERLRFVYNELDLLLTEAVERGLFADVRPAEFAALTSLFTFEARAADVPGDWPSATVATRGRAIGELAVELNELERNHRVPESRAPDPGFAETAYYWASGVDLEDLFDDEFAAGDFVRNCRQLLDLMRQLRDAFPPLASTASDAIRAVDRGVVAAGGRM